MLLIALFVVLAILIVRSFFLLLGKGALSRTSTIGTIVAAFLLGALVQPLFASRQSAPVAIAPVAVATTAPLPGRAVPPMGISLSPAALSRLALTSNPPALGYIGSLTSYHGVAPSDYSFRAGTPLLMGGWAADPRTHKPGAALLLIVDGTRKSVTQYYGVARPDVAAVFKTLDMERTAFVNIPISTTGLAIGVHVLQIGVVSADGHCYISPNLARGFTLF